MEKRVRTGLECKSLGKNGRVAGSGIAACLDGPTEALSQQVRWRSSVIQKVTVF